MSKGQYGRDGAWPGDFQNKYSTHSADSVLPGGEAGKRVVMRSPCAGAALDPPLWTVVPNKALSLSLSLAPILQGLFPPFRGALCDVTESAILGGWYRGVTVRV